MSGLRNGIPQLGLAWSAVCFAGPPDALHAPCLAHTIRVARSAVATWRGPMQPPVGTPWPTTTNSTHRIRVRRVRQRGRHVVHPGVPLRTRRLLSPLNQRRSLVLLLGPRQSVGHLQNASGVARASVSPPRLSFSGVGELARVQVAQSKRARGFGLASVRLPQAPPQPAR